jgi:hypothetical protein
MTPSLHSSRRSARIVALSLATYAALLTMSAVGRSPNVESERPATGSTPTLVTTTIARLPRPPAHLRGFHRVNSPVMPVRPARSIGRH